MNTVMRHLWLAFALIGVLAVTSCDNNDSPTPTETIPSRTVLVYMVADNSLNSRTDDDVDEMMQGILNVDETRMKTNLLLYLDDYSLPVLYQIRNNNGTAEKSVLREYSSELTSTEPSTLESVLNYVRTNYAADSYGFVYWSHGDGWMPSSLMRVRSKDLRWIGQDLNNGNGDRYYGDIDATAQALAAFPNKFDFVLFDACYMLTTEVAYAFRDCTDYIIGSPTEIPGPGAPYDRILPYMFSSQSTYVTDMARAYFDYYNEKYNEGINITNENWTGGVSIGVMSTSQTVSLASATSQALASATQTDAATLRQAVLDYDKRMSSRSHIGYYDFAQMMQSMLSAADYTTWKTAFDQILVYWNTTVQNYSAFVGMFSMEGANGIAQYIPSSSTDPDSKDVAYRSTGWYQAAGLNAIGW